MNASFNGGCIKLNIFAFLMLINIPVIAQDNLDHSHHHNMSLDEAGMVMNSNSKNLPRDCQQITREYQFEVIANTSYAAEFPGNIFGLSQHQHKVEPCSRITITFINKDDIRHQWMVHGLPKYLYTAGMFHLEAAGGHQKTGTFIVPSDHKTYLVHCDIAQHMEKGMKAQLVVGNGSGNLWGVPKISNNFFIDSYLPQYSYLMITISFFIGAIAATAYIFIKKQ